MKKFKIKCQVYPLELYVFFTNDTEKVVDYLEKIVYDKRKKLLSQFHRDNYQAITVMLKGGQTVIVFRQDSQKEAGIVAHEAFHAVEFLFERIGIPHDASTSEAYAYLLNYIVDEIDKKVDR